MQLQPPPFFYIYWNPLSKDSNLIENWFSYVKNVSLAKYAADSVGRYIQEISADQIRAIDATGKQICGQLYTGFSALEKQLGLVSTQLADISDSLQGIDSRLGLLVDEVKTSNLLLENVAELLRIPDSQKQRQYHIEMGLKFLKNALKDEDLYQDALTELLAAEKLMPSDYFVLHRIGMIYLLVPALGNLEMAAEYFIRAGKYAAVESDPNAARLSNILNKRVNKKFSEQKDSLSHEIAEMTAESYLQAGTSLYALGRFEEAAKVAEKAVKYYPDEAKHHFFTAKYLARAGKPDEAVSHLQKAVKLVPEMALAAVADFDLNKAQPVLDLLNQLDAEVSGQFQRSLNTLMDWSQNEHQNREVQQLVTESQNGLRQGNYADRVLLLAKLKEWETRHARVNKQLQISLNKLKDWPENGYQYQKVQQSVTGAQNALAKSSYTEKVSLVAELKEWENHLQFVDQLTEMAAFGIGFDAVEAVQLLRKNSPVKAREVWTQKIISGFCLSPELQIISAKTNPTFIERVLLATAIGRFTPYKDEHLIERYIRSFLEQEDLYDDEEKEIQECINGIRTNQKKSVTVNYLNFHTPVGKHLMGELEKRGIVGPSKLGPWPWDDNSFDHRYESRKILIDLDEYCRRNNPLIFSCRKKKTSIKHLESVSGSGNTDKTKGIMDELEVHGIISRGDELRDILIDLNC
jgi:tetratricopeptide (TPR) repeat protein